jgi:hypothetical protein
MLQRIPSITKLPKKDWNYYAKLIAERLSRQRITKKKNKRRRRRPQRLREFKLRKQSDNLDH